ncbi:MAG: hypothetical protein M0Q51_13675 [Bacteroidales bacterium]|nr:hypothetical protein [Bacteroidales bacterium]
MGGLNYIAGLENRYLYQGKEITGDFNLWWHDFHARRFDSQLGRWHVPDPASQFASPYLGMGNNPLIMTDPDGMRIRDWRIWYILFGGQWPGNKNHCFKNYEGWFGRNSYAGGYIGPGSGIGTGGGDILESEIDLGPGGTIRRVGGSPNIGYAEHTDTYFSPLLARHGPSRPDMVDIFMGSNYIKSRNVYPQATTLIYPNPVNLSLQDASYQLLNWANFIFENNIRDIPIGKIVDMNSVRQSGKPFGFMYRGDFIFENEMIYWSTPGPSDIHREENLVAGIAPIKIGENIWAIVFEGYPSCGNCFPNNIFEISFGIRYKLWEKAFNLIWKYEKPWWYAGGYYKNLYLIISNNNNLLLPSPGALHQR